MKMIELSKFRNRSSQKHYNNSNSTSIPIQNESINNTKIGMVKTYQINNKNN